MKKRYKLKKEVKTIIILLICMILILLFIEIANNRKEEIENNPEAYKTRSIQVNIIK